MLLEHGKPRCRLDFIEGLLFKSQPPASNTDLKNIKEIKWASKPEREILQHLIPKAFALCPVGTAPLKRSPVNMAAHTGNVHAGAQCWGNLRSRMDT